MDNIYTLSAFFICQHIGAHLKEKILKQNITQQQLAQDTQLSLSTIKKIEKGEIRSFDSFLRVLRILGKLDNLSSLVDEEPISPIEYYDMVNKLSKHRRHRASGKKSISPKKPESEW